MRFQESLMHLQMDRMLLPEVLAASSILCNHHSLLFTVPGLVFHTITHNTSHLHFYLATSLP